MATKLTWDNDKQQYSAEMEDGSTIFVDGDDFAEAKIERAEAYLKEAHPDASDEDLDTLKETEEYDALVDQAFNELTDADEWENCAVTLEPGQSTSDLGYPVSAWIVA